MQNRFELPMMLCQLIKNTICFLSRPAGYGLQKKHGIPSASGRSYPPQNIDRMACRSGAYHRRKCT